MAASSSYLNQPPRAEPEVRRAALKAKLEASKEIGRREGLSEEFMDEANRDTLRAFDMAEAFGQLFRGMR